jgi:putative flippase GtrA
LSPVSDAMTFKTDCSAALRLLSMLTGMPARVLRDLVKYGLCSLAALCLDASLLFLLVHAGMHYLLAAATSFLAGVLLAYVLSVRFVFADRRFMHPSREIAGFFAIGFAGLLLNQILLFGFIQGFGWSLVLAKASSVVLCFVFNFFFRRTLLFAAKPGPMADAPLA